MKKKTHAKKDKAKLKRVIPNPPSKRQPQGPGTYWIAGVGWRKTFGGGKP